MNTTEIDHEAIARKAYYRLETATGDVSMDLASQSYADWKLSYGKEFADACREAKRGGYDLQGTMGDLLFNQDGFWQMAQDWIGDDIPHRWGTLEYKLEYNKVCDALAKIASFKADYIMTWKYEVPNG